MGRNKGCIPWNKGKSHSEETKRKISLIRKKLMQEGKIVIWNKNLKGTHFSLKTEFKKGHSPYLFKQTQEAKDKISRKLKGRIGWNKGRKGYTNKGSFKKNHIPWCAGTKGLVKCWTKGLTIGTDERLRKLYLKKIGMKYKLKKVNPTSFKKGQFSLERHPFWKGGISFEPYPLGWNKTFKEQIRYRDGYKCQICGVPEIEYGKRLDIHHIDYDKKNLNIDNLISLCNKCHLKTNFNRDYWIIYFEKSEVQNAVAC